MSREGWRVQLESVPLTSNQLGAVMREFRRLGLDAPEDRAERLAVSAGLLGVAALASTCDLTMGQGGRLVRLLRECRSRAELPEARLPAAAAPVRASGGTSQAAEGSSPADRLVTVAAEPGEFAPCGVRRSKALMVGIFLLARALAPGAVAPRGLPFGYGIPQRFR